MLYFILAVVLCCAVGRNIISKAGGDRFSGIVNTLGTNVMSSALAMVVFGATLPNLSLVTGEMVLLALFYAAFSMLSPCLYIVAVGYGNVGVCSLIFGCAFLLPTLFGMVYNSETPSVLFVVGVALIILAVVLVTGKITRGGLRCLIPVTLAMLASGSLGIVQLLFSRNHSPDLQNEFIFVSFTFSFIIALTLSLIMRKVKGAPAKRPDLKYFLLGGALAVCIVTQNRLALILSGSLPAIILFPTSNGGTIALSAVLSALIFKEKFGVRKISAVAAAVLAIILINI